jgi:general stress protein 26
MLVTRPMVTQDRGPFGDLWFVTNIETHKVDEVSWDPHVCIGYYSLKTMEWISVSGIATLSFDRARIRHLYHPDWKAWFSDEGGKLDGGPEDPRLALILVEAHSVIYSKAKYSRPRTLFEIARGIVTGTEPDVSREVRITQDELR